MPAGCATARGLARRRSAADPIFSPLGRRERAGDGVGRLKGRGRGPYQLESRNGPSGAEWKPGWQLLTERSERAPV